MAARAAAGRFSGQAIGLVIDCPVCPVCAGRAWRRIGARTYRLSDHTTLSRYAQKCYRVLFEVWQPGADEVTLTSELCQSCGFISYAPRPTADELDAKYRFLSTLEVDAKAELDTPTEARRALHLHRRVARHLPLRAKSRVLDFGGGHGRLTRELVTRGHECYLADYCDTPVYGVERIATTHDDIPNGTRYDLIIASHVIEHVAEPLAVVTALRRHLSALGHLYVEVPMEIWGRAPLHEEPVTHINFFTPASLQRLLARAGLVTLECRLRGTASGEGYTGLAIQVAAKAGDGEYAMSSAEAVADSERFLNPDLLLKLKRHVLLPKRIPAAIAWRLRRFGNGLKSAYGSHA